MKNLFKRIKGKLVEPGYMMYYKCSECGYSWRMQHDCACNDRCPGCNTEIEPHEVFDLVEGEYIEQAGDNR